MKRSWPVPTFCRAAGLAAFVSLAGLLPLHALAQQDNARFHQAPASAADVRNPHAGNAGAINEGKTLYGSNCAACHGAAAQGNGNVPALASEVVKNAPPGELFWFITHGDVPNGMPAWSSLSDEQRWNIVTYLDSLEPAKSLPGAPTAIASKTPGNWPAPTPPFTDFRYESPGTSRKITVADLPKPYATQSAGNGPQLVARPADAWPKAPKGFKVELFATDLNNPRLLRTAPNGDVFVAETKAGRITVMRGITADGHPKETHVFATGLNKPFGIAFYPAAHPQWVYVGNTDAVVRFAYKDGDLQASGKPEHIADLPHSDGGHSTRDVAFSPDGTRMYVSVGSKSNVDDPDTTPAEKNRADILVLKPDGSDMHIFASGIRNAVGLAVDPASGELWCSVNERDGLGDNLVPDYITHVQEGGFYGWPWWYMGNHQDPRHAGKHPELANRVIVPDVLLHPHNASLQLTFYNGTQFPEAYRGDIFASEHGSWNRSARVGYEVIRVPRHGTARASGEYEDFLTGFVLPSGQAWGRPVGITTASDGSLLVSDDGGNVIWRVSYTGG
ncbi:PQQ-dependent sugar dehydrogenase [Dyella telluris]|uniref:PQQ-dependent sugar dehydrogenase n=1 Tax=Dyella telluris TaxID=2763498 RepID=A0A7G8Q004_9GAMM|nr:PQQ-dependent sugar dehydrogenase [Dyella telluris]QNK00112.1 PQQ-dependent sugar dehydrogenase [Dyella telluris]